MDFGLVSEWRQYTRPTISGNTQIQTTFDSVFDLYDIKNCTQKSTVIRYFQYSGIQNSDLKILALFKGTPM